MQLNKATHRCYPARRRAVVAEGRSGARRSRRFSVGTEQRARILQRFSYTRAVKRHKCRAPCTMESSKLIRRALPKNLGLLELIRAKREWSWKPSVEELRKGFRGWHQRGYLPHFDAPGVTQFVTFQLQGAFPVTRRVEWEVITRQSDDSAKRKQLEAWLDRGRRESWLRHRQVAKLLGRRGQFWAEDYFDTLVRDIEHLRRTIQYIEQNPAKAFLAKNARDWKWSSAPYRDEFERLPWQRGERVSGIYAASMPKRQE